MGSAFKIGRVAGIDLKVLWTFFLAFFAFAFFLIGQAGNLVGMLTIEDVSQASLLRQPTRR